MWTDGRSRYIQDEPANAALNYANLRQKLTQASADGGLYLQFVGFADGDATLSRIYDYSVYALYPKRVLVGDPEQLANGPGQISAINIPRDDRWLAEHHIGSVLTVSYTGGEPELGPVHRVAGLHPAENFATSSGESAHGFSCAIFLLCCLIVGYAIVATFARDQSLLEQLGYAAVLGPGVLGLLMIYLSLVGLVPSRLEIFCCTSPFAIIAAPQWRSRSRSLPIISAHRTPLETVASRFCILAIAYAMLTLVTTTLLYPALAWDAFSIWQLKAKVLATLPLHPRPDYFSTLCLSYTHLRYPILASMMSAGVHTASGGFDRLSSAPDLLLFGGMGIVVFFALRQRVPLVPSLIVTALLMNLGTMYHWAGAGTAEMPLTAFYICSILCLLRWIHEGNAGSLILSSLFTACMAWAKNEGVALAAINLLVVLIVNVKRSGPIVVHTALFYAIVGILCLPWAMFIRALPRTDEDYAGRLTPHNLLANTGRLPAILHGFIAEMMRFDRWGIFWLLMIALIVAAAFQRQFRSPSVKLLLMLLVLHLLVYIPAFMVTNWKIDDLMACSSDRLLMHAAPVAAVLIGWLWPRYDLPVSARQR